MTRLLSLLSALALVPASASAGAGTVRPPVALTAAPSHVELAGSTTTKVTVTNSGSARVIVDAARAGFSLDLRGRPTIASIAGVRRSAATWIAVHPRTLVLRAGGSGAVSLTSTLPARAEPGDHDALVLFTTRRRAQDGVAVRMRMGVMVVVRAPGAVVHRVRLGSARVVPTRSARIVELGIANRGNVTESLASPAVSGSLFARGRRLAQLRVVARDLRPGTRGVLQLVYRGRVRGRCVLKVAVGLETGRTMVRTYPLRL